MKVISELPPDYFYQYVKESNGWFIFQDKLTPMVRVYSPIPDLSELKQWCVLVSMQYNKSEKTKYPYSVHFKLFPIDDPNKREKKVTIIRNYFKSRFPHTLQSCLFYCAFPVNISGQEVPSWVSYSFI